MDNVGVGGGRGGRGGKRRGRGGGEDGGVTEKREEY